MGTTIYLLAVKVAMYFDLQMSKDNALSITFSAPPLLLCCGIRKYEILAQGASGRLCCSFGWAYSLLVLYKL